MSTNVSLFTIIKLVIVVIVMMGVSMAGAPDPIQCPQGYTWSDRAQVCKKNAIPAWFLPHYRAHLHHIVTISWTCCCLIKIGTIRTGYFQLRFLMTNVYRNTIYMFIFRMIWEALKRRNSLRIYFFVVIGGRLPPSFIFFWLSRELRYTR